MGTTCSSSFGTSMGDSRIVPETSSLLFLRNIKNFKTSSMHSPSILGTASEKNRLKRISSDQICRSVTVPTFKMDREQSRKNLYHSNDEITTVSDSRNSRANYGSVREGLLKLTPSSYQCRLFCGGATCKYCDSNAFPLDLQAVPGLYSTWISDDIMASARPTMITIERFDLFRALKSQNIVSVINLQRPYEHSQCGPPFPSKLEFAYDPEDFMKEKFFHYNFGWPDFGCSTVACLLDMIKVLEFALTQGKVLIHCHAGLGRTGVLICAFLMWQRNYTPTEAIEFVRNKRPGSVQTTPQVDLLMDFDDFLKTLKPIFDSDLTFEQYLKKQQLTLHGTEARLLKHIPKIVFVCCERLLEIANINRYGALKETLHLLFHYDLDNESNHDPLQCIRKLSRIPNILQQCQCPNFEVHTCPHGGQLPNGFTNTQSDKIGSNQLPHMPQSIISGDRPLLVKGFDEQGSLRNHIGRDEKSEKQSVTSKEINGNTLSNGLDRKKWEHIFESVFQVSSSTIEDVMKLRVKLTENSFLERWHYIADETSSENLLWLMRDWFTSLNEPVLPFDFSFDSSMENPKKLPKSIKWTILYMSIVMNKITGNDPELKHKCARFMTECFTKQRQRNKNAENWFLAMMKCFDEMNEN